MNPIFKAPVTRMGDEAIIDVYTKKTFQYCGSFVTTHPYPADLIKNLNNVANMNYFKCRTHGDYNQESQRDAHNVMREQMGQNQRPQRYGVDYTQITPGNTFDLGA